MKFYRFFSKISPFKKKIPVRRLWPPSYILETSHSGFHFVVLEFPQYFFKILGRIQIYLNLDTNFHVVVLEFLQFWDLSEQWSVSVDVCACSCSVVWFLIYKFCPAFDKNPLKMFEFYPVFDNKFALDESQFLQNYMYFVKCIEKKIIYVCRDTQLKWNFF